MSMAKKLWVLALTVLCLVFLTACRQRIIQSGEVDQVILEEQPVPVEIIDSVTLLGDKNSDRTDPNDSTSSGKGDAKNPNKKDEGDAEQFGGDANSNLPDKNGQKKGIPVTLDANGGSCTVTQIAVANGEPYGDLPAAIRSGYAFVGWYTAKSGGVQVTGDTIVTNSAPHTLYAIWTVRSELAVHFDGNGGRVKSKDASRTLMTGDTYGELPTPLREGYDFDGWYTAPGGGSYISASSVFMGSQDQTLYAHWAYNPYKYWSFILENDIQQMYSCQSKSVYIEFSDHETTTWCSLLDATDSYNVACNRGGDTIVTDEWVNEKNPDVVIKCVSNMGNAGGYYNEMSARFPGRRVLVVPTDALYGSDYQILFYTLQFGKLLYPDWFTNVDVDTASAELGIGSWIYG